MVSLREQISKSVVLFGAIILFSAGNSFAQIVTENPKEKPRAATQEKSTEPPNAAQIELLETRYRFETNGDWRKEVHALVKINSELGVRQFARLNFDYNRSFQSIEIPLVHVTHANGGTSDILPSAITDAPNPAVERFPAYHDVRVKSVRVLGLQPGDSLEYRVATTTRNHPLAPDFWLEHNFDRTGVVTEERFQVELPASLLASSPVILVKNESVRQQLESRLYPPPGCGMCSPPRIASEIDRTLIDPLLLKKFPEHQKGQKQKPQGPSGPPRVPSSAPPEEPLPTFEYGKVQLLVRPSASTATIEKSGEGSAAWVSYLWKHSLSPHDDIDKSSDSSALEDVPDLQIARDSYWPSLSSQLYKMFSLPERLPEETTTLSQQLTARAETPKAKAERIYDFISEKVETIDLPLGVTGFKARSLAEIISSGYATQEDKYFLFKGLAKAANLEVDALLIGASRKILALTTNPATFSHLIVQAGGVLLDPSLEVAPFGALPASYRGSTALILGLDDGPLVDLPASQMVGQIPKDLPFPSFQRVDLNASLDSDGKVKANLKYVLRGDNELLLRVAFHKTPKEKWTDIAKLLALSDGFRGEIVSVDASDPYATKEPFRVEYEITQEKFVDWSKKPVRIPALLPLPGLPEAPKKPASGSKIELGTPLEINLSGTLKLPTGVTAQVPVGTSVKRDYATFVSQYSAEQNVLHFSRHLNFISSQLPAERTIDLNAFLHAVQSDQALLFELDKPKSVASGKPK